MVNQALLISIFISNLLFIFMAIAVVFNWKTIIKTMIKKYGKIILSDSYDENISELLPGFKHSSIFTVIENSLRAESGSVLHRPISSMKKWPHFDSITFIPAQTDPFPINREKNVNISVTIGPKAKKPLTLQIPVLISGMGYGVGLSEEAKMALAQAATKIGTAVNSGEGGYLQKERDAAQHFILQFSKTAWAKEDSVLKQADMIEIKLGQGAAVGIGAKIAPEKLEGNVRGIMNLAENEDAIIHEHFFENQTLADLKQMVSELKNVTGGVPVGIKIAASGKIEEDLDNLLSLDIDFISIDGGQGGTHDSPTITLDAFGIPTLHAVVRASKHLTKLKKKSDVSLIVSGGLLTPEHFLKALALGADAVYVGTAILFAMSHNQTLKSLPWEPPTQLIWYDGKYADQFDVKKGAEAAYNYLHAVTEEMKVGLRAMGKTELLELSKDDLTSWDYTVSHHCEIPYSFASPSQQQKTSQEKQ